jgi:hypothetical protein
VVADDPDGDSVSLKIDWGDGVISEWSGLVASGAAFTATHAWAREGVYHVRAMARDSKGALSGWSVSDSIRVTPPLGILRWHYSSASWVTTPAIGSDGTIYATGTVYATGQATIYAIHPDGSLRWELPVQGRFLSQVALGPDDALYIGAEDSLRALNPDGSARWAVHMRSYAKPAIATDGTIYGAGYVNDTSCLIALDSTGSMLWHAPVDGFELSPSIAPDGTICVPIEFGGVTAFYPNGETRWLFPDQVLSGSTVDADRTAHVGLHHCGGLIVLTGDGHLKWRFAHSEESFPGGVSIGPDGTLYGGEINCDRTDGDYDIYFYAISPDGSVKWRYLIPDWDETTPAVCADGTVYFGTGVAFYALDASGKAKWYWPMWECSSPAVDAAGTVYVARDGIYAFAGTSPLANSPWPKYGCDARNSSCAVGR